MPPLRDAVDLAPVVRSLSPDEVPWFVSRSLSYLGHSDPQGLSLRMAPSIKDPRGDSKRCFVFVNEDRSPSAGIYLRAPEPYDDVQTLFFASPWHHDDRGALTQLVAELLADNPHEAAVLELHSLDGRLRQELAVDLAGLGFILDEVQHLRFELSEVPPIGVPLVLAAWTAGADRSFRNFHAEAESRPISDARWAFLKRRHGPFQPDLWFLAHETLDQDPVGYSFCGAHERRIDATYSLDAVGVRREFREDSEMLRRLVISTLSELSARSPLGVVGAELSGSDPKLIDILAAVGFERHGRTPLLVKPPR